MPHGSMLPPPRGRRPAQAWSPPQASGPSEGSKTQHEPAPLPTEARGVLGAPPSARAAGASSVTAEGQGESHRAVQPGSSRRPNGPGVSYGKSPSGCSLRPPRGDPGSSSSHSVSPGSWGPWGEGSGFTKSRCARAGELHLPRTPVLPRLHLYVREPIPWRQDVLLTQEAHRPQVLGVTRWDGPQLVPRRAHCTRLTRLLLPSFSGSFSHYFGHVGCAVAGRVPRGLKLTPASQEARRGW